MPRYSPAFGRPSTRRPRRRVSRQVGPTTSERRRASRSTRQQNAPRKVRPTIRAVRTGGSAYETRTPSGKYTQREQRTRLVRRLKRQVPEAFKGNLGPTADRTTAQAILAERRSDRAEREAEADKSVLERGLEHGVTGFIDKDVSDVGRSIVFGSENPDVKDFATTAVTGAAGGAAGLAIKKAGGAAARKVGQTLGKKTPKPVSQTRAGKKVAKELERKKTPGVSRTTGKPAKGRVRTARQKVKAEKARKATRRAEKRSKRPAPIRKAGEGLEPLRRHKYATGTGALTLGPGAVGTAKTGDPGKLTAPVEGTAKALASDPVKVLKTTARTIPGLITAPISLAANAGLSGYRAARSEAIPDVLGGGKYSGKEVVTPAKTAGKEVFDFGKEMVEDLGSGDPKRIEKAVEEKYGLTPAIMAGIPGLKVAGKMGAGKAIARGADKVVPDKTPVVGKRKRTERKARKEEAREAAFAETAGDQWAGTVAKPIIKEARKVKGSRKTVRRRKQKVDPSDTLKVVAEEGITTKAQAQRVRDRLGDRPDDIDPKLVTAHDALDYIIENPHVLKDKHYQRALEKVRESSKEIETSARAKHGPQAVTHGVKLPEERYLDERKAITKQLKDPDDPRQLELLPKKDKETLADIEAKATREFEAEMAQLRKDKNLAEPAYTKDSDVARRGSLAAVPGFPKRGAKAPKRSELILTRKGTADQSFEALLEGTVREPRVKRAQHQRTVDFAENAAIPVRVKGPKGRSRTQTEETIRVKNPPPAETLRPVKASRDASLRPLSERLKELKQQKGKPGVSVEDAVVGSGTVTRGAKHIVYRNDQGKPVGLMTVNFEPRFNKKGRLTSFDTQRVSHIEVEVLPAYRRKGIASKLAEKAYEAGIPIHRASNDSFTGEGAALRNTLASRADQLAEMAFPLVRVKSARRGERETKYLTSAEIRKASDQLDRENHVVVDSQQFRQAVLDPDVAVEKGFGELPLKEFIKLREGEARGGLEISKGKKYIVVEKARAKEFFDQMNPDRGPVEGALATTQRGTQRALLGYSPSWLALQPIAEGAQALAAVGPRHLIQGRRALKRMSPTERRQFREHVGASSGMGLVKDHTASLDPRTSSLSKELSGLKNTRTGRAAHGILTGEYAQKADRAKGAAIREVVAAGKVHREYHSFQKGMKGLIQRSKQLEKMPLEKRLARIAKDRKLGRELEGYVDDVMGNWRALTRNERAAASVIIFYPFVRMSLSWVFHSYPKRHPIKASIQHFLAQQNANIVEEALAGDPSFFAQWASAPIYGGKEGEVTSMMPLQRIAPGSNALVEALGDVGGPQDLLRGTNPVLSATAAGLGGFDPLSGRSLLDRGEEQDYKTALGAVVAQLASLPAPIRALDTATGQKISKALKGQEKTPTSALFEHLQGGPLKKLIRSQAGPAPIAPANAARQKQMAEIGRLLGRKYGRPEDYGEAIEAMNQAAKKGDQSKAIGLARETLLSLNADKMLEKVFDQYGLTYPEQKDSFSKGAGAILGKFEADMKREDIIQNLLDAGIRPPNVPPFRPRKLRKRK